MRPPIIGLLMSILIGVTANGGAMAPFSVQQRGEVRIQAEFPTNWWMLRINLGFDSDYLPTSLKELKEKGKNENMKSKM